MKFKAPEGCNSINVGGEEFTVDKNGLIETPDGGDYLSLVAPHGFTVAPNAEQTPWAPKTAKAAAKPAADTEGK